MELFIPDNDPIEFMFILCNCWWFIGEPIFCCIASWSVDFTIELFILGWQGLPSRTRTGTATRRGDGSGFKSKPFSCLERFNLYRWFWNHILTCTGLSLIILAKCSLSGADRYLCCLNRRSSSYVWAFENKTLRFRFFCDSLLLVLFSLLFSQLLSLCPSDFTVVWLLFTPEWLSVVEISLEWLESPGEFRWDTSERKKSLNKGLQSENSHYNLIKTVYTL